MQADPAAYDTSALTASLAEPLMLNLALLKARELSGSSLKFSTSFCLKEIMKYERLDTI